MSLQSFFNQFSDIIHGQPAVAELRKLILQLAIRGKLLSQDPADEPASSQLDLLLDERAHLVMQKKIRRVREIEIPVPNESASRLPSSWGIEWLGNVAETITKGATPTTYGHAFQADGIRFIKVENVKNGRILSETIEDFISEHAHESQARSQLQLGDVLFSIAGTIGETCVVTEDDLPANTNQALAIIRGIKVTFRPAFLKLQLDSFIANAVRARARGGAMNNISLTDLKGLLVYIPPLKEQDRIIRKVNELLRLCENLETTQLAKRESRIRLNSAALSPLNKAASLSRAEFEQAISRLAEHFDTLYDSIDTIGKLRSTILQLAVQGKLVPQDSNDESASALLQRVKNQQQQLIKKGRIRTITLSPIDWNQTPFHLPMGWTWARFPELGEFSRGRSKHRPRNAPELYVGGSYKLVQTGDVARSNGTITTFTGLYNDAGLTQSRMWPAGTMCITIAANIADSGILGFDACFPDSVVGFVPSSIIGGAQYFEYFMRTAKSHLQDFAPSTAQKNINISILQDVLIPLPPLAEQKRIVAKVDQLMALCDDLEAKLRQAETDGEKLMDAAVKHVLDVVAGKRESQREPALAFSSTEI